MSHGRSYSVNVAFAIFVAVLSTSFAVTPIVKPIIQGRRAIIVRKIAQLPKIGKKAAQITCITPFAGSLYVVNSLPGLIYRVSSSNVVSLWFNATFAISQKGRKLHTDSIIFSGVRSIAMHPTFSKTGLFYISTVEYRLKNENPDWFISKPKSGERRALVDSVLTEFRYDHVKKRVIPWSHRQVFRIGLPRIDHPIRQIAFQNNYLLITHGDGSHGYDSFKQVVGGGQNNDALGKILRINPLKSGKLPYTIPSDNPFVKNKKYIPEIFALGFRNPHSICYSKRSGIFGVDVGRNNVEEVNIVKSGGDYGWAKREGTFVHLEKGGTNAGIQTLPADDAKYGFIYPVAMYGHVAPVGTKNSGTAIAGACPIENNSPLNGLYIYCNFGARGDMYYSFIVAMKNAITTGDPKKLTQARTYRFKILWDHDGKASTGYKNVTTFQELLSKETKKPLSRVDLRLGAASDGTTYVTSKQTGGVYLIVNSMPKPKV